MQTYKGLQGVRALHGAPTETTDGGLTRAILGHEYFTYDVHIDAVALQAMAHRAARSKRGKSVDGPLEVRITARQSKPF